MNTMNFHTVALQRRQAKCNQAFARQCIFRHLHFKTVTFELNFRAWIVFLVFHHYDADTQAVHISIYYCKYCHNVVKECVKNVVSGLR